MHMMAIRYGDDIIVIDAGMMFPEAELLGVDIVTPDLTYLKENRQHVRALLLTHGHEDHIGAVAFFLAEFNVPVYGTPSRSPLSSAGSKSTRWTKPDLRTVKPKDMIEIGPFKVEFIHVTHSIVSCVALAITTPLGVIIHTGDYQSRSDAHRQRAVRSAHAGRLRQARRAAAAFRFHQCGPAGIFGFRARRASAPRRRFQPRRRAGCSFPASARRFTGCSR